MKVIDISDWNDNIDWAAVAEICGGVIIKISEGRSGAELYREHLRNAKRYGLDWGVYCLTHAQDPDRARQEAQVVISELNNNIPPLGIWYDVEYDHAAALDAATVNECASSFITCFNRIDLSAGVYASLSTLIETGMPDALAKYVPYWCAQYNDTCDFFKYFPDNYLDGWQQRDDYEINGEFYDLNEWY